VDRGELLERFHPAEPGHRPFSSSEGEVTVLGAIAQPARRLLEIRRANFLQRGAV